MIAVQRREQASRDRSSSSRRFSCPRTPWRRTGPPSPGEATQSYQMAYSQGSTAFGKAKEKVAPARLASVKNFGFNSFLIDLLAIHVRNCQLLCRGNVLLLYSDARRLHFGLRINSAESSQDEAALLAGRGSYSLFNAAP